MKKIYYTIWKDIEKLIPDFDFSDFSKTSSPDETDSNLISYLKKYYLEHLPIEVDVWRSVNDPSDTLLAKDGFYSQINFITFICERILSGLSKTSVIPYVISIHTSKSVVLPVYQIKLEDFGIEMILRNNFYDWKLSISSIRELNFNTMNLFDETSIFSKSYCEGFPVDKIYGSYSSDKSKFTIELDSNYDLYTFFILLSNHLLTNLE